MAGLSLIELMIAITLGLIVLAGLATLFANQSAARAEMERSTRQIENGRFAMELLGDDLRMAGFYGELAVTNTTAPEPGAMIDPCSFTVTDWKSSIAHHVYGYDNGAGAPGCIPADLKAGTDILVVRRVSTCEAGVAGCAAAVNGKPYIQVARCATEVAVTTNAFEMGVSGTAPFTRTQRDCATRASLRQYYVRIYYISTDNGAGVNVPTLKRLDFNDTTDAWVTTPLVEGIEEFQVEYGIDADGDGDPDGYTATPATFNPAGCGTCTPVHNWASVMAVRIHLLARNLEASVNYTDPKTYTLGRDATGTVISVTPGGAFRRHAYGGLVRVVNPAERRDTP
jgi:type IV pilus assembly protein PilW